MVRDLNDPYVWQSYVDFEDELIALRQSIVVTGRAFRDLFSEFSQKIQATPPPDLQVMEKFWHTLLEHFGDSLKNACVSFYIHAFALFDGFLYSFIKEALAARPGMLETTGLKFDAREVISVATTADAIELVAHKEAVACTSTNVEQQAGYFNQRWGVNWWSGVSFRREEFIEAVARRNAWVHGGGKVNREYLKQAGAPYQKPLGVELTVNEDDLRIALVQIESIAKLIAKSIRHP